MLVRKNTEGEYIVCRRGVGSRGRKTVEKTCKYWFLVKYNSKNRGYIPTRRIFLPKELIGKRVRLKVELMKNASN